MRSLQGAAREIADRLRRFKPEIARSFANRIQHHAGLARRRKAWETARDKARAQLQFAPDAPHIGFDHEVIGGCKIGEIVDPSAAHLHHTPRNQPLRLNPLADEPGIQAGHLQAADPQPGWTILQHAGDMGRTLVARLD